MARLHDQNQGHFRCARQNQHAPAGFLGDNLDDAFAFLKTQADEIARAAVGMQPADALLDEPVHHESPLGFIDAANVHKWPWIRGKMPLSMAT